jgi:hypothetical protein
VAPTVSITDNAPGVATGPTTFTFTFSEAVTGFDASDVSVSAGATKGAFTALSAAVYTLVIVPPGNAVGDITVVVPAAAAVDVAGNRSVAAAGVVQSFDTDTTRPTVTVTDNVPGATATGPVTFTFTFSEPVSGFTASDVVVSGGSKGALTATSDVAFSIVVTPTAGVQSGVITVDLPAGAVVDRGENTNAAARATQAYDTQRLSSFTVDDNVSPNRGDVNNGETTNDRTPSITLTLDAVLGSGETLSFSRDGQVVRSLTSGRTLSFTEPTISTGPHTYSAVITDAAGNTTLLDLNGSLAGTSFVFSVI